MEHTGKDGAPKILPECTLPVTGKGVVHLIITDLCVFEILRGRLVLREILAPELSIDDIRLRTAAPFVVDLSARN
jgi:acyl CoA:acetate/3-ketoacid CoA transferase beta subunit